MIKAAFSDFENNPLEGSNSVFCEVLDRLGVLTVRDQNDADVLIYSTSGEDHKTFGGIKIFYTKDPVKPLWNECDYAITFMKEGIEYPECHYRFPSWLLKHYKTFAGAKEPFSRNPDEIKKRHFRFCNFIYTNEKPEERKQFLKSLSMYKVVDIAGRFLNNVGYGVEDKIDYCSKYKFSIDFESYPASGYTSEKVFDALAAGSLPVYWGDPEIVNEVNPARIIHARDFNDFNELADYVASLDRNNDLYLEYFKEPVFAEGQLHVEDYISGLEKFLKDIFDKGRILRNNRPEEDACDSKVHGYPIMDRYDDGKNWESVGEERVTFAYPIERKMAVCIHSYKRVEELLRQLFSMFNQSYPHFDVFAAVKGIPETVVNLLIRPPLQKYIDAGRLTLRIFPNRNQLSNFLDTVRGIDLSPYDLFLKVDDDDFYSKDYLRTVNEFHSTIPPGSSSYHSGSGWFKEHRNGFACLTATPVLALGSSLVLDREVMKSLLDWESNPALMRSKSLQCSAESGYRHLGLGEDHLIMMACRENGIRNIAPFLELRGIHDHLIVQTGNSSVTRGGMLAPDFKEQNCHISTDPNRDEHLLEVAHKNWRDSLRILGKRAHRIKVDTEGADILSLSPDSVTLKWDHWGTETFVKEEKTGLYRFREQ